jgi:2'-5' RNA ligase
MATGNWAKSHHSAVVIIPPEEVWEPIQALRRKYDRQIHRWMPHINLLYPFVAEQYFQEVMPLLQSVAAKVPAFRLRLGKFRWFCHPTGRATVWLEPEPCEAVRGLQAILQEVVPQCDELSRFPQGYTPHLSIGQTAAPGVEAFAGRLQAQWQPLEFAVEHVAVIARGAEEPFAVRHRLFLASRKNQAAMSPAPAAPPAHQRV